MEPTMKLELDGRVAILQRFRKPLTPRTYATPATVGYSAARAPLVSGHASYRKHIWALSCLLTTDEALALEGIAALSDYKRTSGARIGYEITIHDLLWPLVEPWKQRPLADGAPPLVENAHGDVIYHAKFLGIIVDGPTITDEGHMVQVGVTLQETETLLG